MNAPAIKATRIVVKYSRRSQFRSTNRLNPRYPLMICCTMTLQYSSSNDNLPAEYGENANRKMALL